MVLGGQTDVKAAADHSNVKQLMDLDKVRWYNKPNLRRLYVTLVPAVLAVEMTSGYDGRCIK